MKLHIWGTDFRRSSVEMRSRLWIDPSERESVLRGFLEAGFTDLVYLSTCNRVEFFTTARDHFCDTRPLWLKVLRHFGLSDEDFYRGYYLEGKSAIRHLLRVASSLESMVVGEPQILGQLKESVAWNQAQGMPLDPSLRKTFQLAFETAKRVRSETEIGERPVSVASLGLQWLQDHETEVPLQRVVVVGRSPMSVFIVQWLQKHRPGCPILWVNRSVDKLAEFPESKGTEVLSLHQFLSSPPDFSHLFTATSSAHPIFTGEFLHSFCGENQLLFDFAAPPDIDLHDAALSCVRVIRLEDLREQADRNSLARANAVVAAEALIESALKSFCLEQKEAPLLRDLNAIEPDLLSEFQSMFAALESEFPPDLQPRLKNWAEKLFKKSLHHSREHLRTVLRKVIEPGGELDPIA